MNENLKLSSSPHIRSKMTVSSIRLYMILALLPTTVFGIYTFEAHALKVISITIVTTVLTEYLYQKMLRKTITIGTFHSLYIGLLLGLSMPSHTPWWLCIVGSMFAVLVMKQTRIIHPVLGTKCFLVILFAKYMALNESTPLEILQSGENIELMDVLLGNTVGSIGTISTIAVLIGAAFMVVMEVIDIRIPAAYLAAFIAFLLIFDGRGFDVTYLVAQLCGESLMLSVWFMAPDYATAPITKFGKVIYGLILGIITGVIRVFGGMTDGVMIAIVVGNLFVPMIEKFTKTRVRNR